MDNKYAEMTREDLIHAVEMAHARIERDSQELYDTRRMFATLIWQEGGWKPQERSAQVTIRRTTIDDLPRSDRLEFVRWDSEDGVEIKVRELPAKDVKS